MGFDGSECNHAFVGSAVAHHADGLDREEDREDLAGLSIQTCGDDFFEQDLVGVADDFEFLFGDVTEHTHGQTRAGERMPPDDGIGNAEDGS